VTPAPDPIATTSFEDLTRLVASSRRIVALTGAGCSTESGIPDYRDDTGAWKRKPPIFYADFVGRDDARRRYWARSLVGWPGFAAARPGAAHAALARLEAIGRVHHVVTQNVDRLHQRAGSMRVTDLHGRLDEVACLSCRAVEEREAYQTRLREANPSFAAPAATLAPDGDADLEHADFATFRVPECRTCGGVVKPSVVFFGEVVPAPRVREAYERVAEADLLLVAGTSLEIFSGRRFVTDAAARGTPIAIVNRGTTRADELATVRVTGSVGLILRELASRL
jgi:NAD-dependent SIR2 family protein deacetylase